jgi:hypothetical protein
MNPSWLTVENANTFLISLWARAIVAARRAVKAPVTAITLLAVGAKAYRNDIRASK